MIEITEVRISLRDDDEKLKAFANITIGESFVVRGLKVIQGNGGLFVAMPSRKKKDGTFQDIAHPINQETREMLEGRVIDAYHEERARGGTPTSGHGGTPTSEEDAQEGWNTVLPDPAKSRR